MDNRDSLDDTGGVVEPADPGTRTTIYMPTQPGWFVDPIPGSPATRSRYFDGAGWTERTHDDTQPEPEPPPAVEATGDLGPGLRADSGFVVGLIGGACGEGAAMALVAVAHSLGWSDHSRFTSAYVVLPVGVFGAVLAAALLTSNAAMIDRRMAWRWLVRGLLLGGGVGIVGFAGAALVWAGANDGDGRILVAIGLFYGFLGLSMGLSVGVARGGAVLRTGLAGGTVGATVGLLSGPLFVIASPIIAAAIGAAVGAVRPR